MKSLLACTLCLSISASVVVAQVTPTTPTTTTTTPGTTTTGGATEKPKPISTTDRSFLKKSLDTMYFLTNLTDRHKRDKFKSEDVKKLAEKMNTDINKIWGELDNYSTEANDALPSKLSGGDEGKAKRLAKQEDEKYDKEFLKLAGKESEQLSRYFESAAKSSQHPQIKQVASNWSVTLKSHADEIENLEKAANKAK